MDKLQKITEGFLFASDKALSAEKIVQLFPEGEQPTIELVQEAIDALVLSFEDHGIELKKVKSGYRFQVRQETASWVSKLWDEKPAKYTRAMLETLALIVYRQPITRGEIEEIRGVSVSSYIIKTMMERNWIKVIGHRDVPGRPALFASTREFLDYFNLSSLEELPPLSEIKDLDAIATELDPEQNAALISAIREMQNEGETTTVPEEIETISNEAEAKPETKPETETINLELALEPTEDQKTFGDLLSNLTEPEDTPFNEEENELEKDNEFVESEAVEPDAQ